MSDDLILAGKNASRKEKYELLLPQLVALVENEEDLIANVSNIIAALKETLDVLWIGIYFVKNNTLVLGPFQGPVACTRIAKGRGVCGTVWAEKRPLIVPDVELFPGHIACNSSSKSEIVLPGFKDGDVSFVIDLDSSLLNDFDSIDQEYLLKVVALIEKMI